MASVVALYIVGSSCPFVLWTLWLGSLSNLAHSADRFLQTELPQAAQGEEPPAARWVLLSHDSHVSHGTLAGVT